MTHERLIVADAGPIIALASIGRFEVLQSLATDVMVPIAVHAEVLAGAPRPGAKEIAAANWLRIVEAPTDLATAFRLVVDQGEAEALALAQGHPGALLVVDDQRARRVAEELGLRLTGTLGVLGMCKRAGILTHVRPEIEQLTRAGFRIEEGLAAAFLRTLSE
jgi:predicted nucleic acid-binding protein